VQNNFISYKPLLRRM